MRFLFPVTDLTSRRNAKSRRTRRTARDAPVQLLMPRKNLAVAPPIEACHWRNASHSLQRAKKRPCGNCNLHRPFLSHLLRGVLMDTTELTVLWRIVRSVVRPAFLLS